MPTSWSHQHRDGSTWHHEIGVACPRVDYTEVEFGMQNSIWRCEHYSHDTERCTPTKHYPKADNTEDLAERIWRDFDHHTAAAFWDVATWKDLSWSPGSLDGADRKRIVIAAINAAIKELTRPEKESS